MSYCGCRDLVVLSCRGRSTELGRPRISVVQTGSAIIAISLSSQPGFENLVLKSDTGGATYSDY